MSYLLRNGRLYICITWGLLEAGGGAWIRPGRGDDAHPDRTLHSDVVDQRPEAIALATDSERPPPLGIDRRADEVVVGHVERELGVRSLNVLVGRGIALVHAPGCGPLRPHPQKELRVRARGAVQAIDRIERCRHGGEGSSDPGAGDLLAFWKPKDVAATTTPASGQAGANCPHEGALGWKHIRATATYHAP
jgi:hypothetical protein